LANQDALICEAANGKNGSESEPRNSMHNRMKKRIKNHFLWLSLLAVGCAAPSTQNNYERDKPTYQASNIKDKRVETDAFLAQKFKVLEIRQTTVQGDLMKVNVLVLNDDDWAGNVIYKFEWLDDQGMAVDTSSSAWVSQNFGARETLPLVSIAPNGRCKDFHLKMQQDLRN
jgi:uncharacterized protein YcfL